MLAYTCHFATERLGSQGSGIKAYNAAARQARDHTSYLNWNSIYGQCI